MNHSTTPPRHRVFEAGTIRYDESLRDLHVNGQRRSIEAKPLALLHTLLVHAGATVSKRDLIEAAWGNADHIAESSLTTAMSKLRAALGETGRDLIEVVHGSGYRIALPVDVATLQTRIAQAFALGPGDRVPGRPHWRLERLLGASGAARNIWLARQGKTGEARVFKFATTAAELETLRREANLSRILHATLGPRDDFIRIVEWDFDHPPYFIESAYGGVSLPQWAAEDGALASLGLQARLGLVAAIARSVAAAHAAGVLHGDIKPANILADTVPGGTPRLRLIDFGAGGLSDSARLALLAVELTTTTMDSLPQRSFTIGYIAPEVRAAAPATTAADIYALGILAYQLAAGDLTLMPGVGWQDAIADALLRQDIIAATAIDPSQRLDSAAAFAERLETLPARRAAQDLRDAEQRRAAALARRAELATHRRPWIAAAALSLTAALAVSTLFAIQAARDRNATRRRAETTQAVNDFLTLDLLGRGDPAQSGKPDETLMDAAQAAEAGIGRRLAHDPLIAGALYLALARAFDSRTAFDAARHAYGQAATAFDAAGHPADAVITRLHLAMMEAICGQAGGLTRATHLLADARTRLPGLGPLQPEAAIWLQATQSVLDMFNGDLKAAQAGLRSSVAAAESMPDKFDQATRLSLRRRLAFTYVRMGQWQQASDMLAEVLQREIALNGPRHPDTLHVQLNQVEVLLGSGQPAKVVAEADRLEPLFVSILGPDNKLTLDLRENRAEALAKLTRYGDAVRDAMAVYQANVKADGPHSSKTLLMLSYVAQNQCRAGDLVHGVAAARAAYDGTLGAPPILNQAAAGNLAFCLVAAKDDASAGPYLKRIGAELLAYSATDPDIMAQMALMRADVAFADGDMAEGKRQCAIATPLLNRPGADMYLVNWKQRLDGMTATASLQR
jgi:DNA-binding winged helix-turn-helix (wHTH) protein